MKVPALRRYREARGETRKQVGKRARKSAAYIGMIENRARPLSYAETRKTIAEKGYLLPLDVFDALRAGRIGVEKALESALDQKVSHDATECCTADVA